MEIWERPNNIGNKINNEGFIDREKYIAYLSILPLSSLAKLFSMSDGSLNAWVCIECKEGVRGAR